MKRITLSCPESLANFLEILNQNKEKLLIFDFEKRVMWASDQKSELNTFDFPEEGKVFFAENEAQVNNALKTIFKDQDSPATSPSRFLAVVRPASQ